jgi:hypothetical protein
MPKVYIRNRQMTVGNNALKKGNTAMKKAFCAIGTVSVLFLTCIDSPLSDVEITDFGLISGMFIVSKDFNASRTIETVSASIRDKNLFGIHIKNGSVTVNGQTMSFESISKTYLRNIPVTRDNTYTFVVTLPNGDTSISVVTTPKAEFGEVSYPDPIHIQQDSAIHWTEIAGSGNYLDISLNVKHPSDTFPVTYFTYTAVERSIDDNGRCALTHDMFDPSRHTGDGTLTLTRKSLGDISKKLRIPSSAMATFKWSRSDLRLVK